MKHFTVYNEILGEFVAKANNMEKPGEGLEIEWRIITQALTNPDLTPKLLSIQFCEKYNIEISEIVIKEGLRRINLNSVSLRQEMAHCVQIVVGDIKNALNGDKNGIENLETFLERGIEKSEEGRIKFRYKSLLTYLFNIDETFKNEDHNVVVTVFKEHYCERVLKRLLVAICQKEGIVKRKDALKVIEKTQQTINAVPFRESELTGNKDAQIERLLFEITNYQNTIEMLQATLDDLKDSITDAAKEAEKSAVSNFFIKLNSAQYGNILDNFVVVENKLSEIKKLNIKIPNQVMPLTIIFRQLLRFIKDVGIAPTESIGRTFQAKYSDIAVMNYNGQPFMDDDEVKTIEVEKCGWKYGDTLISVPTVREKADF